MIGRRRFLKAIFGASLGAVTRGVGEIVETMTTRKTSNKVLSTFTGDQICDAKFFILPYVELMTSWPAGAVEHFYTEGRLTKS